MSLDVVDGHLQCHACQQHFKSHSSHLTHIAINHPDRIDNLPVGRLGNVVFYQPTAKLFHCHICFYTTNFYPHIYDHLLVRHCLSEKVKRKEEGEAEEGDKPDDEVDGDWEGDGGCEETKVGGEDVLNAPVPAQSLLTLPVERRTKEEDTRKGGRKETEKRDSSDPSLKRKRSLTTDAREEDVEEGENVKPGSVIVDPTQEEKEKVVLVDPTQEEKEKVVLTKYTLFSGNRYVCRLCGWKSKMKGFIMSHVGRSHNVPKAFACKQCDRSYILESQLLNHVSLWHRHGLYRCPFCFFSSDLLRGMRRHCNRCSTRLDDGEGSDAGAELEQ